MVKRCVIPDCSLEGDFSHYFHFPEDSNLLDQWLKKLPLLNFGSLNFKGVVLCERHFNPKEVIFGQGLIKKLVENSVPEYFPQIEKIDSNNYSCRFCLRKLGGKSIIVDDLVKSYYENLVQEELWNDYPQTFSCESCCNAIRNSSFIKTKVQENQIRLMNLAMKERNPEIKEEVPEGEEEMIVTPDMKLREKTENCSRSSRNIKEYSEDTKRSRK